jgi:cell division protein FtsL
MSKSPKSPKKRFWNRKRLRLTFEAIVTVTAIISTIVAVRNTMSLSDAKVELTTTQEQSQSMHVEINNLIEQVEDSSSEQEALESTIAELEARLQAYESTPLTEPLDGDGNPGDTALGYLKVSDNVASDNCRGYSWAETPVQYGETNYSRGFNCRMYASSSYMPIGDIDFIVPNEASRLVGVAGIDVGSTETEMRVVFSVYAVPEVVAPLWTTELGFSGTEPFDIDVSGVSRVRFEVAMVEPRSSKNLRAGFADVRFA